MKLTGPHRKAKELFRMLLLEFGVENTLPMNLLIGAIKKIYFPFADESIIESFEKDMESVLVNFANEYGEITEDNFIKAMV